MTEQIVTSIMDRFQEVVIVVRHAQDKKSEFSPITFSTAEFAGLSDKQRGIELAQRAIQKGILSDPLATTDYRISSGDNGPAIGIYGKSPNLTMALDRFTCNRDLWNEFNTSFFKRLADVSRINH